jgi:arylsulfatase A-like enzyme
MFAAPRPKEELYDRATDPWELNNLADDPAHASTLAELRGILDQWIRETGDKGQIPETEAAYDADMAVYLASQKRNPTMSTSSKRTSPK